MYANVVKIKITARLQRCNDIVMEWCSEEEEIDHDGIIQIYFCAELIVLLCSRSVCMGIVFFNIWLYVISSIENCSSNDWDGV